MSASSKYMCCSGRAPRSGDPIVESAFDADRVDTLADLRSYALGRRRSVGGRDRQRNAVDIEDPRLVVTVLQGDRAGRVRATLDEPFRSVLHVRRSIAIDGVVPHLRDVDVRE